MVNMDTPPPSNPSTLVNGETLNTYVGKRGRTVVKVQRNEGGVLVGQSADGHQLTIRGAPNAPVSNYVEIIGIAESNQSIHAELCKDFGENFDAVAFNGLCKLANNNVIKPLFL